VIDGEISSETMVRAIESSRGVSERVSARVASAEGKESAAQQSDEGGEYCRSSNGSLKS